MNWLHQPSLFPQYSLSLADSRNTLCPKTFSNRMWITTLGLYTLLSSNMFSGSAVTLSLTIFAKSSSSFRRSVTDSSRNKFPCNLEINYYQYKRLSRLGECVYLLAGVSGGAGHSVTVDHWLLSHVEPHSLCCLLSRTAGHFLQNISETLACRLSTAKNWEPSNLTYLFISELFQSSNEFIDLSEIWSTY